MSKVGGLGVHEDLKHTFVLNITHVLGGHYSLVNNVPPIRNVVGDELQLF